MQKKSKIQITYHKKTDLLLQFGRRYSEQSFGAFILHLPCLVTQNTNILFDGTIKYIYLVWKIFLFRDRLLALNNLIIFCILSRKFIDCVTLCCIQRSLTVDHAFTYWLNQFMNFIKHGITIYILHVTPTSDKQPFYS